MTKRPTIDLNKIAVPLLALAIAVDSDRVNGKLRYRGYHSPEAQQAVEDWLSTIEDQPNQPGLSTMDRVYAAIVGKLMREDVAAAYLDHVEFCRVGRLDADRQLAEAAAGRERLAAQKAEREQRKAERERLRAELRDAELQTQAAEHDRRQAALQRAEMEARRKDPWSNNVVNGLI